jgi:hypothetical protein
MYLTLGIIIDEFAGYKPIIHKMSNKTTQIRQFHYYSDELAAPIELMFYVKQLSAIFPKALVSVLFSQRQEHQRRGRRPLRSPQHPHLPLGQSRRTFTHRPQTAGSKENAPVSHVLFDCAAVVTGRVICFRAPLRSTGYRNRKGVS